jgi:hypothetical protein
MMKNNREDIKKNCFVSGACLDSRLREDDKSRNRGESLIRRTEVMVNLGVLQKDFLEGYRGDSSFENYIHLKGPSPRNRLSIYHNTIRAGLRKALEFTYPLTWELIGEDCANGAAYAFIREYSHLPQTGILDDWEAAFPDFLGQFSPTQSLAYLPDFARLEWLKHVSSSAEDQVSLSAHDFKDMNAESYGKLILKLHPSVHFLSSSYPLDQILAVVKGEVVSVELESRKSYVLLIRPTHFVHIHWLSEVDFSFFSYLQKGDSLIDALEKMDQKEFHFQETLSFSLQNGLFSEYAFTS